MNYRVEAPVGTVLRGQRFSPLFHAVSGETTSTRSAIRSAKLDLYRAARMVTAKIRISVNGAAIFPRKLLPPSYEWEPAAPANHAHRKPRPSSLRVTLMRVCDRHPGHFYVNTAAFCNFESI